VAKRLKVLADTSGIIVLLDASDKHHESVIEVIDNYDKSIKYEWVEEFLLLTKIQIF